MEAPEALPRRLTVAESRRRRGTSVVVRQFVRHEPLPWNIKVNFDAAPAPKHRSQTLALGHGPLAVKATRNQGNRPRNLSTAAPDRSSKVTKPQKRLSISHKWWAARLDGTQSKVRYIFGPSPNDETDDAATSKNKRSSSSTTRTRRIRKRFMLPIVIEGRSGPSKILAFPDTGSDHNIMSLDVVNELGLVMEEMGDASLRFSVANGKIVEAIGQISVKFGFAGVLPAEDSSSTGLFFVFSQLAVPTIIGRALLEQTQTFTKHRHRLIQEIVPSLQCLSLTSIAQPRRDLCCRLNGNIAYATADTGSDLDLVSPEFAESKGFNIDPAFEKVQFADGSYGVTCGVVESTFSIGSQDVNDFFVQRGAHIQRDFYVLESLTSEILVGLETLEKLQVYDSYPDSLVHRMSVLSFSDANIVRYIGSLEYLTKAALKKMKNQISNKKPGDSIASTDDQALRKDLLFADQRENARREVVKLTISNLTGNAKLKAQFDEEVRIKAYEEERERRLEPQKPSKDQDSLTSLSSIDSIEATNNQMLSLPKVDRKSFYCPQDECHFSEGLRSFSTEEERDLHRRLHGPSGYVCPFCPQNKITFQGHKLGSRLLANHVMSEHPRLNLSEPLLQHIFNPVFISP